MTSLASPVRSEPLAGVGASSASRLDGHRTAVRRTDWRFLLPSPSGKPFAHLVLLGGPAGVADTVRALGIARAVSTALPPSPCADAVVRLVDGGVDLRSAASAVALGGVLYAEFDRRIPGMRTATPARVRRLLRAAGLTACDVFWVRNGFADHRVYLPADEPGAVAWYFEHVHHAYPDTGRRRATTASFRLAAALGPRTLGGLLRSFAVTAVRGGSAAPSPSVLGAAGLPEALRGVRLRPLVIAPRLRRVVLLPFAEGGREPLAALKVGRVPEQDAQTAAEQRALGTLAGRLDAGLRATVPTPLGSYRWGPLLVGVESCVPGRLLACPPPPWPRAGERTRAQDLRAVASWLGELHARTRSRADGWGTAALARLERALEDYGRLYGLTADERRLFDRTRVAGRGLAGVPLPMVFGHHDLNAKNTYRTRSGVAVVDWEQGGEELPVLDLLFFVEEWLHHATSPRPGLEGRLRRFRRVLVDADPRDPATGVVREAIARYLEQVGVARAFLPVLHVLLWTEAAVWRARHAGDLDQDEIAQAIGARCVGCVRALAAGGPRFFGEESDA